MNDYRYIAGCALGFTLTARKGEKTYFPDLADVKNRNIRYIEVYNAMQSFHDTDGLEIQRLSSLDSVYISLMENNTNNYFFKDAQIKDFSVYTRKGMKQKIYKQVDLINSYVTNSTNQDVNIFFVIYYDHPNIGYHQANKEISNCDSITVRRFDAGKYRFEIGEQRNLFGKKIRSFFLDSPLGSGKSSGLTPNGENICQQTVTQSCFLTLVKNNFEFFQNIPLSAFYTEDRIAQLNLADVEFDFTNSYIQVSPNVALNIKSGDCIFLNCEYV